MIEKISEKAEDNKDTGAREELFCDGMNEEEH